MAVSHVAPVRPLKVLHILHELKFSGAEVMLKLAAAELQARGLELHILSDTPTAGTGDYTAELVRAGYSVHHLPCPVGRPPRLAAVVRFLRAQHFDVVHNHTEQNFFWYGLATRLAGVPRLVYTVHNCFAFTGAVRYKRLLYRLVARRVFGMRFTAIGPSVQQVEQQTFFNPTTLIPNWMDEAHLLPAHNDAEQLDARRALGLRPDDVAIVSVGSCTAVKNHTDVFTALSLLSAAEATRFVYLHVGDGPMHAQEEACAHSLGLYPHVRFLGQLTDVRPVLIASDIFVMPSRFEGLSIALLEAQYCALPAVVYNVNGLRDLVVDGCTGRLVPSQPEALAQALAELAAAPALRRQLGQAARAYAQAHYNMKDSLTHLLRLYAVSPKASKQQPEATASAAEHWAGSPG
jgi:glycosyltransferase involved in cell wall biosynthesis